MSFTRIASFSNADQSELLCVPSDILNDAFIAANYETIDASGVAAGTTLAYGVAQMSSYIDTITAASVGTYITLASKGIYELKLYKVSSNDSKLIYYENGVPRAETVSHEISKIVTIDSVTGEPVTFYKDLAFYIDNENHLVRLVVFSYAFYFQGCSYYMGHSHEAVDESRWYTYFSHFGPNDYKGIDWSSWDVLRGNNGQYRCNLLKINKDSIADNITGYHGYELEDFTRLSNESSIWNSFLNAQIGVEYEIGWSGQCRLTLTVTNFVGNDALKVFTFKFYFPGTSSPFFTYSQNIPISSSTASNNIRNYYLSFLYDDNTQIAAFYPIAYLPQSSAQYQSNGSGSLSDNDKTNMWLWLQASSAGDPEYPYDTGTTDNGGQPTTDLLPNDEMPSVTAPTLAGTASGLFTIYCPNDTDLANIAAFLWSDNVIDNFKKYFNNFSDNIIALYVLPYKPSNLPTKAFKVGRVVSDTITSVEYVTTRFVTIDMGEITIGGCWDSYLDFSPYTKFNVYLPGIGIQALDADDILAPLDRNKNFGEELGSTISLQYNLDLMTGIVVAYIKINGQIRYQFSGKIGYSIPLTGETHRTLLQGFAMATAGAIGTIASGGSAAPFAAAAASAAIINAMKPDVYRGSNLSGDVASLCYESPYLIRRVPNKPQLVNQDRFTGFQSYKTGLLSEFSGYTEVEEVHAEGFVCTEEEREEIIELLKKGVIL